MPVPSKFFEIDKHLPAIPKREDGGKGAKKKKQQKMVKPKNALVQQMDKRAMARSLIVTTVDWKIKKQLRLMRLPITLFGEAPENRRDRLRYALVELSDAKREEITGISHSGAFGMFGDGQNKDIERRHHDLALKLHKEDLNHATFFHKGIEELHDSRQFIANYSIPKAKRRIRSYRNLQRNPIKMTIYNQHVQHLQNGLREGIENIASQIACTRPISSIKFSPCSTKMATSSWSRNCHVWSVPECKKIWENDQSLAEDEIEGHKLNVGDIAWNPKYGLNIDDIDVHLASCSFDGEVKLWNLDQTEPLADLGEQGCRVSRLEFHPSARMLGTTCHDASWRLWDLAVGQEVLHQEGHVRPTFSIKFHPDGSLAGTAGLDGYGRIWDLRTGRCIMFMEGHTQEVYDIDFNQNGVHLVTGSADNTIKVWDLRQTAKAIKTLPAHNSLITRLVYDKKYPGNFSSNYLISSGYDRTIKVWSSPGYVQLRELSVMSKVMGLDVSADRKYLAASCYDKSFKLWTFNEREDLFKDFNSEDYAKPAVEFMKTDHMKDMQPVKKEDLKIKDEVKEESVAPEEMETDTAANLQFPVSTAEDRGEIETFKAPPPPPPAVSQPADEPEDLVPAKKPRQKFSLAEESNDVSVPIETSRWDDDLMDE